MSGNVTNINDVSISIIYVIGGLFTLFAIIGTIVSSYAFFVVKSVREKMDDIKETSKQKDVDLEKILNSHEGTHVKLFDKANGNTERIAKVETNLSNLRTEHHRNHSGGN